MKRRSQAGSGVLEVSYRPAAATPIAIMKIREVRRASRRKMSSTQVSVLAALARRRTINSRMPQIRVVVTTPTIRPRSHSRYEMPKRA